MGSRMDRYRTHSDDTTISRSDKNKELYTSLDNHARYTTIEDIENSNAILLTDSSKKVPTRESYQKTKDFEDLDLIEYEPIKKELNDFNYLYQEKGNKIHDLNTLIEEAKKSRLEETKNISTPAPRKADIEKYFLTKEELEQYQKIKNKEIIPDKEEVKELINTITSKTLRGEIDQITSVDLLSDLMATEKEDAIEAQVPEEKKESADQKIEKLEKEIKADADFLKKVQEQKDSYTPISKEKALLKDMDQSFYTRSMDLSDKDFDLDNEFHDEKKVPAIFKIFLIILLILLFAVLIYFIIQSI